MKEKPVTIGGIGKDEKAVTLGKSKRKKDKRSAVSSIIGRADFGRRY